MLGQALVATNDGLITRKHALLEATLTRGPGRSPEAYAQSRWRTAMKNDLAHPISPSLGAGCLHAWRLRDGAARLPDAPKLASRSGSPGWVKGRRYRQLQPPVTKRVATITQKDHTMMNFAFRWLDARFYRSFAMRRPMQDARKPSVTRSAPRGRADHQGISDDSPGTPPGGSGRAREAAILGGSREASPDVQEHSAALFSSPRVTLGQSTGRCHRGRIL